jgi:DNA-binding transcriptional ArsR family regulator
MANKHRLVILSELHKGERSVKALQPAIGLSQSSLSQGLGTLRDDNVVVAGVHKQSVARWKKSRQQVIWRSVRALLLARMLGVIDDGRPMSIGQIPAPSQILSPPVASSAGFCPMAILLTPPPGATFT